MGYNDYLDIAAGRKPGTSMGATTPQYDAYKKTAGTGLGATWGSLAGQTYMNGKKFQQTYDANGMGSGGYYTDDTGANLGAYQVDPTPIAKPAPSAAVQAVSSAAPTGFYWNNAPVSEADYRRLQGAGSGAAPAASPTSNMNLSSTSSAVDALRDNVKENRQRFNQVYDRVNAQVNPYDTNSDAFKHTVADTTNRTTMQFAGADRAAQEALAGRGMMGSGYEAAGLGSIIGQRGAALSGAVNGLYSDAYHNAGQFENSKSAALAALVNGDYSGTISSLDALSKLPGQLAGQELNNAGAAIENRVAEVKAKYADQIAQAGLTEAQVRAQLLKYEQSDAEWDRANPAAAFARDLASGAVKGIANGVGQGVAHMIGG